MPKFSRIMRQVKKRNSKIRLNLRTVLNKNLRRNIRKYISIKRVKKHNKKTRKLVGGSQTENFQGKIQELPKCYNPNKCKTCDIKPQKNNTIPGELIKSSVNWDDLQEQNCVRACDGAKKAREAVRERIVALKKITKGKVTVPTKNRYSDILPNDSTRVILRWPIKDLKTPNGKKILSNDYINANTINFPTSVTPVNPSYNYIATQCPMANTVDDFWRMVLEKNVQNIVMINAETELNKKCYKYFPDNETPKVNACIIRGKQYKIKRVSYSNFHAYSVSVFEIFTTNEVKKKLGKNLIKEEEVLKVNHYWYKHWPDQQVISNENNTCIELIHRIHHHHQSKSTLSNKSPLLVHCSAGVGRTGTFIGLDIGIRLYHLNFTINVENIVQFLRCNRNNYMVQTEEQYDYLYNTLKRYTIERNKKISPSKNILKSTKKKLFKLTL